MAQYKIKDRPRSMKAKRNPRPYWIQVHLKDGKIDNRHKNMSWNGVTAVCDNIIRYQHNVEAIALIDGNLPESELLFPPEKSVWARWSVEADSVCRFAVTG